MKRKILTLIGILLLGQGGFGAEQAWQVTGKAWKALGQKKYDEVVRLADLSEKRWGARAKEMNSGLDAYPKGKAAKKFANLNELATITFIKGEALRKKGDKAGAIAAYKKLLSDYKYGQCWDKKGWWWQPAKAARDKLNKLAPDEAAVIEIKAPQLKAPLKLPGKRGICFTLRELGKKGSYEVNLPKIKKLKPYWNYSWGMNRVAGQPANIEFVPMAWGAWGKEGLQKNLDSKVIPLIKSGKVKRFLGFNEPDKHDQANMKVKEVLKYWPMLEALNVPLCSPACANALGKDDASNQGVGGNWMRTFMKEVEKKGLRIDYIGVHWYGGTGATSFKERMVEIYNAYGKRPLLVTEFAPADWGAKTPAKNHHSKEEVLAFMKEVLPWMEKQNWIAGYAWYSWMPHESAGSSSALIDKDGNLTTCGKYYSSITNENPDGDQSIK